MKSAIVALTLVASSMVFAQGAAAEGSAKVDKKTAKMECLKENPNLKGKELSHCVKSKVK